MKLKFAKTQTIRLLSPFLLLFLLSQANLSLWGQSYGGGLFYTSYLPFGSIYNVLTTENKLTGGARLIQGFEFKSKDVLHYAPGVGITNMVAIKGLLTAFNFGIIAGAGPNNIIPDFPVRPFVQLDAGYSITKLGILRLYIIAGLYGDFAIGKGKSNYDFIHLLGYVNVGPGVSMKFDKLEIFAQVRLGVGVQMESISLETKSGEDLYNATYVMVPVALFPELGVRMWF